MKYLILDSSNINLCVGLKDDQKLVDQITYPCFQRQSEFMVEEINNLLKRNNLSMKDMNGILVSIGPGSYTGIRIALTIAKVSGLLLNIPVYTISSLSAQRIINKKSIILLNARSNRSYICAYDNDNKILDDQVMENEKVLEFIKTHNDYELVGDLDYLNLKGLKVDLMDNMNLLFDEFKKYDNPDLIKPIYLKDKY